MRMRRWRERGKEEGKDERVEAIGIEKEKEIKRGELAADE